MKKLFFLTSLFIIALSVSFSACEKNENTPAPTTTNCKDSAYLLADSITYNCTGKNLFYIVGRNKTIAVATGLYTAIDTITRGAYFYITYDSLSTTTACNGAVYTNALLSCYQRR